jgi:osmotically-inducible protein OsmY
MMAEVRAERTDIDIEADIERIMAHYPPLTHDRRFIHVTVQNGTVTVSGYTRTGITRRYLIEALTKIPDVARVDADRLYSDDAVRLEIGRLIPAGVIANVYYGVVVLTGAALNGANAANITAAVENVPGVRMVQVQP